MELFHLKLYIKNDGGDFYLAESIQYALPN